MKFLYINKSSEPLKVVRMKASSVEEAVSMLAESNVTNFDLYLNLKDNYLTDMNRRVELLEQEIHILKSSASEVKKKKTVDQAATNTDNVNNEKESRKRSDKIHIELLEKNLGPSHPLLNDQGKMIFSIKVHNHADRPVRAIKGTIIFTDLFDADVFRISVTINKKIEPQKNITWEGEMTYNCFNEAQSLFAGFAKDDMKLIFEEENIIYA